VIDREHEVAPEVAHANPAGANLAQLLPSPTRRPYLIGIDGRSGAGKTTLAEQLTEVLRPLRDVTVFHLEDLYPGWDGLRAGTTTYVERILVPLRHGRDAEWTAWDWVTGSPGTPRLTRVAEVVVLEGVGACSARARELLDVSVWVELHTSLRYDRALSRDGSYYAEHWDRWAAQEDAYLSDDHVWEEVDILHPGPVC
jgi:uridine kinase